MRTLAALLACLALPAVASAAAPAHPPERPRLRLGVVAARPGPGLEVGALRLDGLRVPSLAVDEGSGADSRRRGARVEPVLAMILGFFPGFGLGHLVVDSPRFTLWLVVDVALAAVWYFGVWGSPYWLEPGPGRGLVGLAIFVERIVEGLDAYRSAGGRGLGTLPPGGQGRLAEAVPVADPALARGMPRL